MKDESLQYLVDPIRVTLDQLLSYPLPDDLHKAILESGKHLELMEQSIQEANQAKTKFVSVVTHELRIPMTSIKGYTDLLRQGAVGPVNEQQANFLGVIRNNVDRMSTLVSDLSDISHIDSRRIKLDLALIALPIYVEETLQGYHIKFTEKEQILVVDFPSDLPPVYADAGRVVQVMTNLLNNAWRYTPSGGTITVKARVEGTKVKVEVADTGIGISPTDQKELFTQFFRSEDPAVRDQQGWGLGLTVTKKFLEIMGGEIGVASELKKGSTFWFTLPLNKD